jgi:hypothetical protein
MMETRDEEAIRKIEERIIASRDPFPCDDFEPVSRTIDYLCSYCGHFRERHEKQP